MTQLSRRSFITGLVSFAVTAPAIVRAGSLMPVKSMVLWPPPLQVSPIFFQGRYFWVARAEPTIVAWAAVGDAEKWIVDAYEMYSGAASA